MDKEFENVADEGLKDIIYEKRNGLVRARAIRELASRAISDHALLDEACRAISSDHKGGMHSIPYGWAGADLIFTSDDPTAIQALLSEMRKWGPPFQKDLVFHWNILTSEAELRDFELKYGCKIDFPPSTQVAPGIWRDT